MQPEQNESQYQQRLHKKAPPDYVAESPPLAPPKKASLRPAYPMEHVISNIADLRNLKPGWLDGEGEIPPPQGLDWLESNMKKHFSQDIPRPHIYPTEEGGAELEWHLSEGRAEEASLEIDLKSRRGFWINFNTETDAEEDLDLNSNAGWERLVQLVRSLTPFNS